MKEKIVQASEKKKSRKYLKNLDRLLKKNSSETLQKPSLVSLYKISKH